VSSRPVPRVGVFGGSFNPIHFGHLLVADEIVEALDLDRLLLVPAAWPPHKPVGDLAPARARFEMTALAVREHERFEVCDLELRRPGLSYTVDTLEALRGRGELHLVIGSETFLDLLSWKDPLRVARLARLVVVPRIGTGFDPEAPAAQKVLAELGLPGFAQVRAAADGSATAGPLLVAASSLPISASEIRRRAREGRSLAYRLPDSVVGYIREHHLYRSEPR
jgi:nicotinate-nucleotide adenylyltransferase